MYKRQAVHGDERRRTVKHIVDVGEQGEAILHLEPRADVDIGPRGDLVVDQRRPCPVKIAAIDITRTDVEAEAGIFISCLLYTSRCV